MGKYTPALFLLLVLLILNFLYSCDNQTVGDYQTTEPNQNSDGIASDSESDTLDARQSVADDIPELDFKGEVFRMLYQERYTTDAYSEELNGEILNDTIYYRNQNVSERFNVTIVPIVSQESALTGMLINSVNAGDDEFDLYMGHALYSGTAALNGMFINWYDIEYIDFTKPWFPPFAINELTLNGRMYMTVSDMCLSLVSNVYCMYFDKIGVDSYGLPNIYDLVLDGKWTVDMLDQLTKDVYVDINGSDTRDENDFYGFVTEQTNAMPAYLFASNIPVANFYDDMTIDVVFDSEKTSNLLDKLRKLVNTNIGTYKSSDSDSIIKSFNDGNALFLNAVLNNSVSSFRERENDYGIIPYPKYDEIQENYYTIAGGSVTALAIPKTVQNTAKIGAVTAALCAESWKNVLPAYYDIVLKVKGARDETSVKIMDLILEGRFINLAFMYDDWKGYTYAIGPLINSTQDFASYCAANESKIMIQYQKIIDLFFSEE